MSSDNYKIRELNELNERLHENAQGSEIIIRELKIEIKRIKEKLKDSELRIEWITDKYGCRQPINTNPKRVFALKEENEQLKKEIISWKKVRDEFLSSKVNNDCSHLVYDHDTLEYFCELNGFKKDEACIDCEGDG